MLKIEHISKTFNPGTVNEKQAIKDLSRSSVLTEQENQRFLMQSAEISLQIPE